MADNSRFVAVEQWCGFEKLHPPHLWGDILPMPSGGPHMNIWPCPGEPFDDEQEDDDD